MQNYSKVSIIISTYNNASGLKRVLKAMLELDYPEEFEIIVVNDGSSDGTREMMKNEFFEKEFIAKGNDSGKILEKKIEKNISLKFIDFEKNQGVCNARNAGIKIAKFPIVVNMDHDCIPSKDWLKKIVEGFDSEKIGIVSSFGYYGGTSTAFRKDLLQKVGGYDEEYGYYREDTDLSFKIMDLGYEFKKVKADYEHDHKMVKPKNLNELLKHVLQRLKYHENDVLLYKKHPNLAKNFLNVKFGFLVNPMADFRTATGTWHKEEKFSLSSPRGIVFLENKTPLHAIAIVIVGIGYVFAVKTFRLIGSIRFGKFLI